jgi:hypothetical protein
MGIKNKRTPASHPHRTPVLGLDVGGVIVDRAHHGTDTSFFGNQPMATPAVPGAFDAISELVELFEYRVHIVSKAGARIHALTREWLGVSGFFEQTGLLASNVHFVRKRPEKAPVCAAYGITHFVDDRVDVLAHLETAEHRFLFVGGLQPGDTPVVVPGWVTVADTWPNLKNQIARTLGGARSEP